MTKINFQELKIRQKRKIHPTNKKHKDWKVDDASEFVAEAAGLKGWPSPRRPAAAVVSGSAESVSGLESDRDGLSGAPFRLPGDIISLMLFFSVCSKMICGRAGVVGWLACTISLI